MVAVMHTVVMQAVMIKTINPTLLKPDSLPDPRPHMEFPGARI